MRQLIEIESIPIKIETKLTYGKFQPSKDDPLNNQSAYKDSLNQAVKAASAQTPQEMRSTDPVIATQGNTGATQPKISDVYNSGQVEGLSFAQAQSYEAGAALALNRSSVESKDFVKAGIQNVTVSNAAQSISSSSRSPSSYVSSVNGRGAIADNVMEAYEMDRANFQASLEAGAKSFEYVPGDVEFDVVQNPEVRITYTGGFIYVPRSAAPDYVDTSA
jgi:hypothetical protein